MNFLNRLRDPLVINQNQTQDHEVQDLIGFAFDFYKTAIHKRTEKEIIEQGLLSISKISSISGVSFIPFNEWKQNSPPLFFGNMPNQNIFSSDAMIEQVELRQKCKNCVELTSEQNCILLNFNPGTGILCRNVLSHDSKLGIVSVYFDSKNKPTKDHLQLIDKIVEAIGQLAEELENSLKESLAYEYLTKKNFGKEVVNKQVTSIKSLISATLHIQFVHLLFPPSDIRFSMTLDDGLVTKMSSDITWEKITIQWSFQKDNKNRFAYTCSESENQLSWLCVPIFSFIDSTNANPLAYLVLGDVENIQSKFPNDKYFELLVSELSFLIDFDRWTMQKNYQELLDERIRLSREIHDGFAQTLAFLLIQLKRILRFYEEKDEDKFITAFEESYQTLSESYIDIRESISSLRVAPEKDLITTLQPVLYDFEKKTKIPVEQSFEPLLITIPESAIFHIIRILQESLSNIRKHSEATSVEVRGCNQGNNYILIIKDNGIGFDQTDHENEIKDHIGIKSMVERAELIDGKLHIKSAVCAGTEIRLVL